MAAQLRLQAAKVLLVNLSGVGTEVVKNLVLGGINSIEILDDSVIKEHDFAAQFFLPNDLSVVGQVKLPHVIDRIKELNHRVNLSINTSGTDTMLNRSDYLKSFDLIVATELTKSQILALDEVTHHLNIPLYVAGLNGMFGYIFTDLVEHESVSTKSRGNQPTIEGSKITERKIITNVTCDDEKGLDEKVTIKDSFVMLKHIFKGSGNLQKQLNRRQMKHLTAALPLTIASFEFQRPTEIESELEPLELIAKARCVCKALAVPPTILTSDIGHTFARQAFAEFSPVAAVLGGALSQDIIQFLCKNSSPINNVLILDAIHSEMPIFYL